MTGIIDIAALSRLSRAVGNDAVVMRELFESFVEEAAEMFGTLRDAAAAEDWKTVKQEAHSLKGAARDFGARDMAEIAAALEADAETGTVADCDERISRAMSAFDSAVRALEVLLDSGEFK